MELNGTMGTKVKLTIKGVVLLSGPVYSEGAYSVYVGYIEAMPDKDIAHYLVINTTQGVVEGSSARLFEARGLCQAFFKELEDQDTRLAKAIDIVERNDSDGNVDPSYPAPKWRTN